MSKDNIYIGYITKTHGLYGLFSIKLDGSPGFCEACLNIKKLYFEDDMSLNVKHLSQLVLRGKKKRFRFIL